VLRLVKIIKQQMPTPPPRAELVRRLNEDHGFSMTVANWMTTNVQTLDDGKLVWAFDLNVVDELLDDYVKRDMWPGIEKTASPDSRVFFLRAGRNRGWTEDVLAPFKKMKNPNVVLMEMPTAGHFLHAERPKEVWAMMSPSVAEAIAG
jgi:pimeloyl-ACP methyl ester carboxylesterase